MSAFAPTPGPARSTRPGPAGHFFGPGGGIRLALLLAGAVTLAAQAPGQDLHQAPAGNGVQVLAGESIQATTRQDGYQLVVEVRPAKARVCDDLWVRVIFSHPKGASVKEVRLGGAAQAFLVRESQDFPPRADGQAMVFERRYVLEPLQAGQVAIGPVEVTVLRDSPGASGQSVLRTEPIAVALQTVVALPARLEDLRPAAGPLAPAPAQRPPGGRGWAIALGAAAIVLAGLVWRWAAKHSAQVPPSPQAEARRRLAELVANGQAPQDVKAFYVALADIVREYLVRATGVPAPEQTSEECLRSVAEQGLFPAETAEALACFFRSADLVKFARWQPRPAEVRESVRQVELIVQSPVLVQGQRGERLRAEQREAAA